MSELANQVAVVTGAGRGIGQAIAVKLAAAGADIACVDLKQEFYDPSADFRDMAIAGKLTNGPKILKD